MKLRWGINNFQWCRSTSRNSTTNFPLSFSVIYEITLGQFGSVTYENDNADQFGITAYTTSLVTTASWYENYKYFMFHIIGI